MLPYVTKFSLSQFNKTFKNEMSRFFHIVANLIKRIKADNKDKVNALSDLQLVCVVGKTAFTFEQ